MKYLKSIIFNTVLLYLLSTVLLFAQNNESRQIKLSEKQIHQLLIKQIENLNNDDSVNPISDLMLIAQSGGITRMDTSILGGLVLNDTTIQYIGDTYNYTVTYLIDFIKNGEVVDDWSILIDSAKVKYTMEGYVDNIFMYETIQQTAEEFILGGLKAGSQYMTCSSVSPMRILGLKLKLWLILDLFWEEKFDFTNMQIEKLTGDILSGEGLMNLAMIIKGEHFSKIEAHIEFTGGRQAKIYIGDESYIVNFSLRMIFP